MQECGTLDDRQRIDRWLEESQYLIGRLLPAFVDDRERLRAKLASLDEEGERLRAEIGDLRREIGRLQGEVEFYRSEQAAAAEVLASIMDQLGQLQKPVSDLYRRLQSAHPSTTEVPA